MTIFGCESCSCDCPAPCAFTGANCFEISFSGFSDPIDPNYSCTICNTLGDHTIIVKRGSTLTLRARAFAVRPGVAAEGDEDAEFLVTLARDEATDAYSVSDISIVSGGSGYAPGTKIAFEYGYVSVNLSGDETFFCCAGGVRCDRFPFAWITSFGRAEPEVEASLECNAEFAVSLVEGTDDEGNATWSVESVSVQDGGFECTDGAAVSFSTPNGIEVSPATGIARTGRSEPSLGVLLNGSEAFAIVSMTESQDESGRSVYAVQGVDSLFAYEGPAPQPGDAISFVPPDGAVEISAAAAVVQSVDEFFGSVNVTITSPGSYYADTGVVESVEVTDGGEYYKGGAITGVALVKGGEIYNTQDGSFCAFNGRACGSCPTDRGQEIVGRIEFSRNFDNELQAVLRINFADGSFDELTATATGFANDATSITFSEFTTQALCPTATSVTVAAVDCDTPPQSPCDAMPQQIEVTFAGLGRAAVLRGIEPADYPPQQAAANNLCGTTTDAQCFVRSVALDTFPFGTGSESVGEDATIIFELDENFSSCQQYRYRAALPGWRYRDESGASCISPDSEPSVSQGDIFIAKTSCGVTVEPVRQQPPSTKNALCPPEDTCPRGVFVVDDAELAVASTDAGAITAISVISPGTCYAWRVFTYTEPEATAVAPTVLGSGATFSIEWEQYQNEDGDDRWRVLAVTGEGGEGYIDGDAVTLELNAGSCGFGYVGSIITKRIEPQPTLTLPSPGSGGQISYTLAPVAPPPCLRQYGVASVSVAAAGTGYTDGDQITVAISGEGEVVQDAVISIVVLRTEPQVTASIGTASLTPVLSESADLAGKPTWGVASVTVDNGGTGGLSNGDVVTFAVTADENIIPPFATVEVDESGVVTAVNVIVPGQFYNNTGPIDDVVIEDEGYYCGPEEDVAPTLTLTLPGGQDGEVTHGVRTRRIIPCYESWGFESVTVDSAGSGYKDRSEIAITLEQENGGGVEEIPATLLVRVTRTEPVVTASIGNATLSVTLFQLTDFFGDAIWTVSSVEVVEGGSGIAAGDNVSFTIDEGSINLAPTAYVEVDESGSVTAVIVQFGGELVDDIGPIASVEIQSAGQYWTTDSSIGCIVTESAGEYYKATPSGVESDAPVIRIQTACGAGATAEAVVDVDPASETFGGISEVTVTNGGEGYYPLGDAWLLSAASFSLSHMTEPGPGGPDFGTYPNPAADREPGPSGPGYLGNDFLHNAYEPLSARASMLCPADLLTRSYRMWWGQRFGGPLRDAGDNECGKYFQSISGCLTCIFGVDYLTTYVRRFGAEDITITISPVAPE